MPLQPGDLILLTHPLTLPDIYTLRLGVYDPATGQRLLTNAGAEFVELNEPQE